SANVGHDRAAASQHLETLARVADVVEPEGVELDDQHEALPILHAAKLFQQNRLEALDVDLDQTSAARGRGLVDDARSRCSVSWDHLPARHAPSSSRPLLIPRTRTHLHHPYR